MLVGYEILTQYVLPLGMIYVKRRIRYFIKKDRRIENESYYVDMKLATYHRKTKNKKIVLDLGRVRIRTFWWSFNATYKFKKFEMKIEKCASVFNHVNKGFQQSKITKLSFWILVRS